MSALTDPWSTLDLFRRYVETQFDWMIDDAGGIHQYDEMVTSQRAEIEAMMPWLILNDEDSLLKFGAGVTISMFIVLGMARTCHDPDHLNFHTKLAFTRLGFVFRELCKAANVPPPSATTEGDQA